MKDCQALRGGYKIPLLEDIMNITKGKIFINLEIKDKTDNDELWVKVQELIEKYHYYYEKVLIRIEKLFLLS